MREPLIPPDTMDLGVAMRQVRECINSISFPSIAAMNAVLNELERMKRDYGLFEELAPPDVPRATFVRRCFDAWEEKQAD